MYEKGGTMVIAISWIAVAQSLNYTIHNDIKVPLYNALGRCSWSATVFPFFSLPKGNTLYSRILNVYVFFFQLLYLITELITSKHCSASVFFKVVLVLWNDERSSLLCFVRCCSDDVCLSQFPLLFSSKSSQSAILSAVSWPCNLLLASHQQPIICTGTGSHHMDALLLGLQVWEVSSLPKWHMSYSKARVQCPVTFFEPRVLALNALQRYTGSLPLWSHGQNTDRFTEVLIAKNRKAIM